MSTSTGDARVDFARLVRSTLLQVGVEDTTKVVAMMMPDEEVDKFVAHQLKYLAFALVLNEGENEARRMLLDLVRVSSDEIEKLMSIGRKSAAHHRRREAAKGQKIDVLVSA